MANRVMKDSGVEWIGAIPEGWAVKKGKFVFKERMSIGNNICLQLLSPTQKFGVIPQSLYEEYTTQRTVKVDYNKDISSFKTIRNGDYCISLRSFQGGFEYCTYEGVVSPAYKVFYPKEEVNRGYYKYLFKDKGFISKIASYSDSLRDGKSISFSEFGNTVIPIPPLPEQKAIADYLDAKCAEIDSLKADITEQIEVLKQYKQSVITEAVTKGLDPDVPMKDSGIKWIGEIPESWEVNKIKYLGNARNGLTYNPNNLTNEENGIFVIRSSNISDGKLVLGDNVYVNCYVPKEILVKKNDIIICSRNGSAKLIGKNAIVLEDIVATFGAFMMVFRANKGVGNIKYIKYILESDIFKYYLGTFLTSTINQLTNSNFLNMKVIYCNDNNEQKIIADYLDTKCGEIDQIIEAKEEQLKALEEYKKSMIYEYVTGKKEVPQEV